MYLLRPAAMTVCDIGENRPWLKAFPDDLNIQIVRPLLAT